MSLLYEISEDEENKEALSDDEHSRMFLLPTIASDAYLGAIAALEDQIRTMNDDLTALKNLKASKDKKKLKKEKSSPRPLMSKPSKPKPLSPQKNGKKSGKKAGVSENDLFTFDQKRGLKGLFGFDDSDVPIARTV